MRHPVWISILFTFVDGAPQTDKVACYPQSGGPCDSFNLTCDQNKIIRIMQAEYGYKDSGSTDGCCSFDKDDCFANYSHLHAASLYDNCSGKKMCFNNKAQTPVNFNCTNFHGLKYAHVKYDCVLEATVVDMCNGSKQQAREMNVMFKEMKLPIPQSTQCYCQVTAQTSVKYQLVDIRLFTSSVPGYRCINGSFSISGKTIQCLSGSGYENFVYINSPLFQGEITGNGNFSLLLSYKGNVYPDMVWVNLQASMDFEIDCKMSLLTTETTQTVATETTKKTSTQNGNSDGNSLPAIIGVVIPAIIVIAVVAVALIIFKRRQKKRTKDDTHISDLPKGLTNHMYESSTKVGDNNAAVETSNYDIISDESVLNYSLPEKIKKVTTNIPEKAKKYVDVFADEHDKIDLEMKGGNKTSNYDTLPAAEGKIVDDTYSHVSIQSKSFTKATAIINEYSHCKLNSKYTLRNDDDYSHVCLEGDCTKNPEANTNEDDSYNHIDFDDTQYPMRNINSVLAENESRSEKNSPTCTDVMSSDTEGDNYPLNNGDTRVFLIDAHNLGIKAVSLMDNTTELSPRSKEQQYTAVVKAQKVKQSNKIDSVARNNVKSKRPNVLLNTPINSDYKLAKPIDL